METLQRTANRGSISTGYDVDNSLKLEADNSEQLSRNVSSTGSRTTATVSMWIKRTELGAAQYLFTYGNTDNDNGRTLARFQSDDTLRIMGGNTTWRNTTRVFRDTSAWMHIVIAFDTTQSTANDRIKLYINGVQETSFSTTNNPSEDFILGLNFEKQVIGYNSIDGGSYFSGYMTEIVHQDGTASAPTEFGETDSGTGIWKPIDVSSVASGTNGYYLDFKDSSNLGNDASGGTDFTATNITSADQATDTPTNNFCTWIPLWTFLKVAGIENGGTSTNADFNASTWRGAKGSMGVSRGKWYWEQKASGNDTIVGWQTDNCVPDSGTNSHNVISTIAYYEAGNFLWIKDSTSGRNADTMSGSYAGGQIDGMALNLDSSPQTVTFYRNGSAILSNRNIDGLANQTLFPMTSHYNQTSDANFGGYTNFTISSAETDENGYGTFEYAPPSGYYALCTKNLAEYG